MVATKVALRDQKIIFKAIILIFFMVRGEVLWYNKKGFGLAKDENDREIFLHNSNFKFRGELRQGETVFFRVTNEKGRLTGMEIEKKRRPKNTENFNPSDRAPDMNVVVGKGNYTTRDVVLAPADLFCVENDKSIYESLMREIEENSDNEALWKLWHGDTHHIADDHLDWKKNCPTFGGVIDKIRDYFGMDIKATRLNLYKTGGEWKPYHFDAAAVDERKSKTQNFTVGVSFGAERDISFEYANGKQRSVVSFPLKNGQCYAFCRDINTIWRHGVPQKKDNSEGRISIIAWGWVDQKEY